MKRVVALLCILGILVLSGCALGYLPEEKKTEDPEPAVTAEPATVVFEQEEAVSMEAAEPEATEAVSASDAPAQTEPTEGTETETLVWQTAPSITDGGEVGVLFASAVPYELDYTQESVFFSVDLNGDGEAETLYVGPIDTETDCLRFSLGQPSGQTAQTPDGTQGETEAAAQEQQPSNAYDTDIYYVSNIAVARLAEGETLRLLICGDFASDDYLTYVFSVEGDALVCEDMIEARLSVAGSELYFWERYECLGTRDGIRAYAGNPLTPTGDILTPSYIPTAEELATSRDELADEGILLKSKMDLTAKNTNGAEVLLPTGTYVYLVAFTENLDTVWVNTEDGKTYSLETKLPIGGRVLTLNGYPEDMCFSNLSYAD